MDIKELSFEVIRNRIQLKNSKENISATLFSLSIRTASWIVVIF